jgi:DNA-binding GntR family transcriptional regulator
MTLSPLPGRRSLREEITQALRAAVITGHLRPGTVYSVPTLATQFGVSPTPVREAILDLAKEGLVAIAKNKGFRVNGLSDAELDQITEIRALLEIPVVAGLAGALDADQIASLEGLAKAIVDAAAGADLARYLEADTAFHTALLSMAGNPMLVALVTDLRNRTRLFGLDALVHSGRLTDSAAEHVTLVQLLRKGDPEPVAELMRAHLGHVRTIWAAVG